jgi:hypothetical protein
MHTNGYLNTPAPMYLYSQFTTTVVNAFRMAHKWARDRHVPFLNGERRLMECCHPCAFLSELNLLLPLLNSMFQENGTFLYHTQIGFFRTLAFLISNENLS